MTSAVGTNPVGVGPNAITRLAEALALRGGTALAERIFSRAGLVRHLADPPTRLVDEDDVARLHSALVQDLGPSGATEVSAAAGRLTADYLLAHRIPGAAQSLLRRLPRRLAASLLVRAIARHAWTFSGSGHFSYRFAPDHLELTLEGSPVCRRIESDTPACAFLAATFERVFAAILGPATRVVETDCAACGAKACRFVVTWHDPARSG